MPRLLFLLACFASLMLLSTAHAQSTLGQVAAKLPINAAKLVADPTRDRVYALVSASNSVVVIDTTTFDTATIPVGIDPVDMAVSPDDSTLYVANNGSTVVAISVINLDTLTPEPSFSLPRVPQAIFAGPTGILYVTLPDATYQVNSVTGEVGARFDDGEPLQLAADGKTLFVDYEAGLATIDASTEPPQLLLTSSTYPGEGLAISHSGKYFCVPFGDNAGTSGQSTSLYSTADLTTIEGSFINENYPGPLAFSLDDSVVYQYRSGLQGQVIDVFNTQTFLPVQEATLPMPAEDSYHGSDDRLVMDRTGSYLFLNDTYESGGLAYQIVVVTTGAGTLTPPAAPTITSPLTASGFRNTPFTYQIAASNSPSSYSATVLPSGLAVNTTTGLISGTPTSIGKYTITVSATNITGTGSASVVLTIAAVATPTPTPSPTVTPTPSPTATPTPTPTVSPTPTATPKPTATPTATPTPTPTVTPTPTATPTPTPIVIPMVVIIATGDGQAVEGGEAGKVAIARGGDLSVSLTVRYKVAGGAIAGRDYKALPGMATIPAGASQVKIKLKPIDDTAQEGTRVAKVKLLPSLDGSYILGSPAVAKIKIIDND